MGSHKSSSSLVLSLISSFTVDSYILEENDGISGKRSILLACAIIAFRLAICSASSKVGNCELSSISFIGIKSSFFTFGQFFAK